MKTCLYLVVAAALVWLAGCASTSVKWEGTACGEKRPQVCTMRYQPVCAQLLSGQRQTYSSPCNACADVNVKAYISGGRCESLDADG